MLFRSAVIATDAATTFLIGIAKTVVFQGAGAMPLSSWIMALVIGVAVTPGAFIARRIGDRIDVSMAETMLYVNEHAHDHLWDDPVPSGVVRSFRPMDYPVLTAANGESVVVSGHPAENKTFDFYMLSIGRADLIDDPRFGRVRIASLLAPNGLLVEVYERR